MVRNRSTGVGCGRRSLAGAHPGEIGIFAAQRQRDLGIFFAGQSVPSLQPESGTGVITADGKGNLTGVETFNLGTQVCENVALKGTYTVDATTGTGKLTAESEGVADPCAFSFNASFVILKGGALLRLASTDPGFVIISEEWRRRGGD
jgi:hypothetical protein